jgi:UDP-N-acetylglucosamine 4-epimerase
MPLATNEITERIACWYEGRVPQNSFEINSYVAAAMLKGEPIFINGDGETSRDFCYVANAVEANLLAAPTQNIEAVNQVYNVAVGQRTTLNELFGLIRRLLALRDRHFEGVKPVYRDFREGDVRRSQADIGKAAARLGYVPTHRIAAGLELALPWHLGLE